MSSLRLTLSTLKVTVTVPFLYFGAQLVAAPFYPDYSFVRNVASELGSDKAIYPWILNTGLFLVGGSTLVGAFAFLTGLKRYGAAKGIAWIVATLMVLSGIGTIKAGIYPLPDPRHSNWGFLSAALMLTPLCLLIALWRSAGVRWYLVGSLILVGCCIPVFAGATQIDRQSYAGLIQRVFALAVFPPVGVSAWHLLQVLRKGSGR